MHRPALTLPLAVCAALLLPPAAAEAYWKSWPFPPLDLGVNGSAALGTVATADFDGDGDLDIVARVNGSSLAWFENLGNRTFGAAQTLGGSVGFLGAGDWDGDGDADILTVPSLSVAVRTGDGQGGFASPVTVFDFAGPWPSGWPTKGSTIVPNGIVVSDLNGDGRVEVVLSLTNSAPGDPNALLIHMDPVLGGAPVLIDEKDVVGSGPPAVGDVDGDGQQDVVWLDKTGSFPSTLTWFERTGGSWGLGGGIGPDTSQAAVVADVYGLDGHADLLTTSGDLWWQDPCCEPYWTAYSYPGSGARHAFDFDHDGDLDLFLWSSDQFAEPAILENTNGVGTTWGERNNYIGNPLAVADLDGDGAQDVIGATWLGGAASGPLSVAFNPQTVHAILAPPNGAAGRTALIEATGSVEDFAFSATTIAQANEAVPPITENDQLGSTLTFPRSATGLCHSFTVRTLQSGAQLVFDDQEGSAAWDDALSIGDIDNHEQDSFRVTFDGAIPVHGFGLHLLDNITQTAESIRVFDPSGLDIGALLNIITYETIPDSSGNGTSFIGFWSAEPVGAIEFIENESGDDIGIERLAFATGWDTDGDALPDCQEQELTTGWNDPDSDDDGLTDGEEVATHGTNPLLADTDSDGLTDGEEVGTHGTSPLLADTDGDGYDDPTELDRGTDPLDALSFPPPQVPVAGALGMLLLGLALVTSGATRLRRR